MANWTVDSPQRIPLDGAVTRLDVDLVAGRLNVVAADGPARLEVTRIGRRPVLVGYADGRLRVHQERPRRWQGFLRTVFAHWPKVDVSVAVPAGTLADLRLVAGAVVASGLRHETRVDVTSGQVTLMGLAGRTTVKLVDGPVEALGVAGELTMETVSGELILADSPADRIRATAVSGAITCDLDNPAGSDIQLDTISGSITVRVRADSSLAVRLHTTSGRITSSFPEVRSDRRIGSVTDSAGTLGTGDGRLSASATSGSIALLARPAVDAEPEELP
ncbi:DUF4097 family beta strand repeat-containing protein [Micromonospora echinofusca]|uniref:DUF4097 family beta strand repeat protein n=1 Tax=Micromonospora echinofusca TaxID=47858 RepID=A0ABS3VZV6_MICEH|nr:DUF4097 family beta strand repeat-containing protein [Micromonospora echinofusca]MBO4209914.1 DUF4097 family beta strand repeat protein [Micromonospora echinofusca]